MGRVGTTDEVADVGAVAVLGAVVVRHRRDRSRSTAASSPGDKPPQMYRQGEGMART